MPSTQAATAEQPAAEATPAKRRGPLGRAWDALTRPSVLVVHLSARPQVLADLDELAGYLEAEDREEAVIRAVAQSLLLHRELAKAKSATIPGSNPDGRTVEVLLV